MRNFLSARSMVWRRVRSCLSVRRSAWMRRMPKGLGDMGPEASVMVEEATEGVMGGGESGMPGDRGHLNLGPLVSIRKEGVKVKVSGDLASLPAEETVDTDEMLDPVFVLTSFLKEETGEPKPPKRVEGSGGELGGDIVGVVRPEDDGRRVGSWYSRLATTRVT